MAESKLYDVRVFLSETLWFDILERPLPRGYASEHALKAATAGARHALKDGSLVLYPAHRILRVEVREASNG